MLGAKKVKFDNDFRLIKEVVAENILGEKVIPFQTVDQENYTVVECLSYYDNRTNTLLELIDSPIVKQKILDYTVGRSHKEKIHTLSNIFSSARTRLALGSDVISVLNVGRAIEEKEALLKLDHIAEKYSEKADYLFYLTFVIESEMLNQIYTNTLLDMEAPINSELYKQVASLTLNYYLGKYGNQPDVTFVVDYFFNRFTYMYAYLGHSLYIKRQELMVAMAKRIGQKKEESFLMHRLQQANNQM